MSPERTSGEGGARWPLVGAAIVLFALTVVPTANLLTDGVADPQRAAHVRQWLAWLVLTTLLALTFSRFAGAPVRAFLIGADRLLMALPPRVFALVACAITTALCLAAGWMAYGLRPVSGDEVAQLWQATLLAQGHLAAHAPVHPAFFSTSMTVQTDGRWFTQFPVGGAAALAGGMLVGAPWIVNPLLTGCTAAALHAFVRVIDSERIARRATAVFALSPFVLLMGGSQMNHAMVLLGITTALAALAQWARAGEARSAGTWACVIGAALGVAATSRPYDAALAAVPIGLFQLVAVRRNRVLARSLAWQFIGGAVPVGLLLAANHATTGASLLFGYDLLNGPLHRPGFHPGPTLGEHTPLRGLRMASSYLMRLDSALLAWPVPASWLMIGTLLSSRRATRWDVLLLGLLGMLLAGYAAYWAESYFAGPRFLYGALPAFVLLIARFPDALSSRVRGETAKRTVALLVPLWLALAWLLPPNRTHGYGVRTILRLSAEKPSTATTIIEGARAAQLHNALVFVQDGWHARLAARLRSAGLRPLPVEELTATADACTMETELDALESAPDPSGVRAHRALDAILRDTGAVAVSGLRADDQIALVPGRALPPTCMVSQSTTVSNGVSMAALLSSIRVDAGGRLSGDVVYARDLGAANEQLRAEFGTRTWYIAEMTSGGDAVRVRFQPYRRRSEAAPAPPM